MTNIKKKSKCMKLKKIFHHKEDKGSLSKRQLTTCYAVQRTEKAATSGLTATVIIIRRSQTRTAFLFFNMCKIPFVKTANHDVLRSAAY